MRHLFIGGPHDGDWHEIQDPNRHIVQLAEYQSIASFKPKQDGERVVEVTTCRHDYLRTMLRGERNEYVVYMHSDMTCDAVLAALIRKYPCSTPTRPV